jgi:hypothetical protein
MEKWNIVAIETVIAPKVVAIACWKEVSLLQKMLTVFVRVLVVGPL